MPKFESNNTIYDIPDNIVEQFLIDNPNAIEASAEELGKITPTSPGVDVEDTATPEIPDTELPSEDISLDLPKADNIGFGQYAGMASSTIEKEPEEKKSNKEIQQEALRKSISSITGIPEMLVPSTAAVTSGVLDTAAGIGDFFEKYGYAPLAAIVKTGGLGTTNPGATLLEYEKIAKENNLDLSEITNAADLIDNLSVKKFDEQGNEKDIFGLIEEGNYSDAAELAVNQALGSAPSLALSIASPVYGSALLGMSTAGGEFERELKEHIKKRMTNVMRENDNEELNEKYMEDIKFYLMNISRKNKKELNDFIDDTEKKIKNK